MRADGRGFNQLQDPNGICERNAPRSSDNSRHPIPRQNNNERRGREDDWKIGERAVCRDKFAGRRVGCWTDKTQLELVSANSSFRSEEHTSELQSLAYLVSRLLLEK